MRLLTAARSAKATVCYTGDILDPDRAKYNLKYYVGMAKGAEGGRRAYPWPEGYGGPAETGLRPLQILIKALKEEVGLPIHFHTHDTAGIASATILAAAEAGVDAVDCAMDASAATPSRQRLGTMVEALRHTDRDTGLDIEAIREISITGRPCAASTRPLNQAASGPGVRGVSARNAGWPVHQPQGAGAFAGAGRALARGRQMYADVNRMFGDIVKVTPSSKVVGDMALMMVSQNMTTRTGRGPGDRCGFPRLGHRHDARQSGPASGRLPEHHHQEGAEGRGPQHPAPRQGRCLPSILRPPGPSCPSSWKAKRSMTRI